MTVKDFFKITRKKIIVTASIIFLALLSLALFAGLVIAGFDAYPGGITARIVAFAALFFCWPLYINRFLGDAFVVQWDQILDGIEITFMIFYWYLLSCIIAWLFSLRKRQPPPPASA